MKKVKLIDQFVIEDAISQLEDSLSPKDAKAIMIKNLSNNPRKILDILLLTLESLELRGVFNETVKARKKLANMPQKVGSVQREMNLKDKLNFAIELLKTRSPSKILRV